MRRGVASPRPVPHVRRQLPAHLTRVDRQLRQRQDQGRGGRVERARQLRAHLGEESGICPDAGTGQPASSQQDRASQAHHHLLHSGWFYFIFITFIIIIIFIIMEDGGCTVNVASTWQDYTKRGKKFLHPPLKLC